MENANKYTEIFQRVRSEIGRQIVGQDYLIERLLVGLVADGHILLEGVPGLAKTRTLNALTQAIEARMNRIQFTPDLLPSDLIGTEVYNPQNGEFKIRKGPVFTNLLLADEINRAPAKVQSALLQAMQEREVTIGEVTFKLPAPFMVLATQNPIEQEGTYPLPEAQVDRFLMKVKVSYPSFEEELKILNMVANESHRPADIQKVINIEDLIGIRESVKQVFVDPKIDRYIVSIVHASREPDRGGIKGLIEWGASPRASLALKVCARALAFIRGRNFVTPDEVKEISADVLRHRIIISFEAEAQNLDADTIINRILDSVTVP